MSKVGPFKLKDVLYRDMNIACVKGVSKKHKDVLFIFLADKLSSGSDVKEPDEDLVAPQTKAEFDLIKKPFDGEISGLMPLIGCGSCEGHMILAYPYTEALPFYVHMKTVPTIHRRDVLKYIVSVTEIVKNLHQNELFTTEINVGNLFIDSSENFYLPYNNHLSDSAKFEKFYEKKYLKHSQIKRFKVTTPEEVWGNGADYCSDIFQIGVLAVTMLTRRMLKLTSNIKQMGYEQAIAEGHYPGDDFTAGLPKALGKCIVKAIKADPVDRYETIDDLIEGLSEVTEASKITDAVSEVIHNRFSKADNDEIEDEGGAKDSDHTDDSSGSDLGGVGTKGVTDQKEEGLDNKEATDKSVSVPSAAFTPSSKKKKSVRSKNEGAPSLIPPEYEHFKVPAVGVCFLLILFVFWPFGSDNSAPSPKRPTKRPTVKNNSSSTLSSDGIKKSGHSNKTGTGKSSGSGKTSDGKNQSEKTAGSQSANVIDVSFITVDINAAISRPTDKSTYSKRKSLLQKCYRMLPRQHRGKAIRSSVFQLLYEYEKKDKKRAYKFVDDTFSKYYNYLREHNAKM